MSDNYPTSVIGLLDDSKTFNPAALRAIKAFRASKPWRGTVEQRQEKFRLLNAALAGAYGVPEPRLVFETDEAKDSGSSCYIPATNTIILSGRMSVVTFLHEWGHRLHGRSERQVCRWSINLFARVFPKSFSRCQYDGHMIRADRREA